MDILKSSQLLIFSHSTIFITFSYRSLAGFLLFEAAKTGSGVGFLRLTAVWLGLHPTAAFSSPEAALLLVSTKNRDLWPPQRSNECACLSRARARGNGLQHFHRNMQRENGGR